VVCYSRILLRVLKVAEALAAEGIDLEVVDLRTLVPLDEQTILASVQKTSRALIVYEACESGGFGAEVAARIGEKAFDYLDAPVKRVAGIDSPISFQSQNGGLRSA